MKAELEEKLKRAFPYIYSGMNSSTCRWDIQGGLSCGDGWYEIIRNASMELESIVQRLPEKEREKYWACQIKEKFGTLRFYMNASTNEMWEVICKVEELSEYVCEKCGDRGRTVKRQSIGGWLQTLCLGCRIDRRITRFFRRMGSNWDHFICRIKDRLLSPFRKDKE